LVLASRSLQAGDDPSPHWGCAIHFAPMPPGHHDMHSGGGTATVAMVDARGMRPGDSSLMSWFVLRYPLSARKTTARTAAPQRHSESGATALCSRVATVGRSTRWRLVQDVGRFVELKPSPSCHVSRMGLEILGQTDLKIDPVLPCSLPPSANYCLTHLVPVCACARHGRQYAALEPAPWL
jgi:hypothetical protein